MFGPALVPNADPQGGKAAGTEWPVIPLMLCALGAIIWNGSSLLHLIASQQVSGLDPGVQAAAIALVLNVALILFGWRRYADLQQEAALRAGGEHRTALQEATDSITGLADRKGFAEGVDALGRAAVDADHCLVIISLQMQRFKRIDDRFGFDMGDALLKRIGEAVSKHVPTGAVVARRSGDEFAIAAAIRPDALASAERLAEASAPPARWQHPNRGLLGAELFIPVSEEIGLVSP